MVFLKTNKQVVFLNEINMMGQMKQFAYRLAEYIYDEGMRDDEIVEELLLAVRPEEHPEAEEWLRKQIQHLKENPYPTRNMLV